jgi:uncharacterized protein with beta-barrel porin domain
MWNLRVDPSRAPRCALALLAIGSLATALLPSAAEAQCVQNGKDVTCTGTSSGFDAASEDDLIVDIQSGATITSTDATEGFKLNSGNQVDNLGTIDVAGAGALGIDFGAGTGNVVSNGAATDATPTIGVGGDGAIGIRDAAAGLGTNPGVEIHNHGQIDVSGANAVGIQAGENALVTNEPTGVIDVTGADGVGIRTGPKHVDWVNGTGNPIVQNRGTITLGADGAIGIDVGAGMEALNELGATMTVDGTGSIGIRGDDNAAVHSRGFLFVEGTNAVGIEVGDWLEPPPGSNQALWLKTVANPGVMVVNGDGGVGIRVGKDWDTPGVITSPIVNAGDLYVYGAGGKGIETGDNAEVYNGKTGIRAAVIGAWGDGAVGIDMGQNSKFDNEGGVGADGVGAIAIRIGANDSNDPDYISILNAWQIDGGLYSSTTDHGPLIVFEQPSGPMEGVNRIVNLSINDYPQISRIEARLDGVAVQGTNPVDNGSGVEVGGVEIIRNELDGLIHGTLDLRGGDDVVENLGGTITGDIMLGEGDDTYRQTPFAKLTRDIARSAADPNDPDEEITLEGYIDGGSDPDGLDQDTVELLPRSGGGGEPGMLELSRLSRIERIEIQTSAGWILSEASDADLAQVQVRAGGALVWSNALDPSTGQPESTPPSIEGDLLFDPGAELLIELDPANPDPSGPPNLFLQSPISANGQATLDGSAVLILADGGEDMLFQILRQGPVQVRVIDASSLTGRFGDVTPPASVYSVDSVYDDVAGTMEVILRFVSFTGAASTPNQNAVAGHLDDVIQDVNSGALADLMNALLSLNDEELAAAYDQLHPEAYDAQASAMLSMGHRFTRAMLERPRLCIAGSGESRRDPVTGLVCRERKWEPWLEGWGQVRTLTGDTGHISHRDAGGGGVFGVDHRVGPSLRLTGTVGGATNSIEVTDVGPGSLHTIDAGFSASWRRKAWRVQGAFSYSHGWHELSRVIDIPGFQRTTETSYASDRIGLRAETDYVFSLSGWNLAPLASVDYTALYRDGLQEVGAGQAGLLIDSENDSVVTLRAGFQLSPTFKKADYWTEFLEVTDGVWRPRLGLSWRQVVSGQDRPLTSRFIGADPGVTDYTVHGKDARQGFEVSAGFEFTPRRANRITLGVFYDGFLWTNVQAHDVGASLQLAF